ncbi:MAG TPA: PEP-CTERM sorting domain-containing protein [Phycisphaerae bacterium]|nr:PEP-CTERM sorting domain-containing protein [Phycisphaerae bacterium]
MSKRVMAAMAVAAAGICVGRSSFAAGIQTGDLVVLQVGDGNETLANTGNSTFLDEFSTAGVNRNNTIAIPDSGANALIVSGTATSEGAISVSPDGKTITVSGYNTPQATSATSLTKTDSGTVPRGTGAVNAATGAFTFTGTYGANFTKNNVRSSVSDGTHTWGVGANSGVVLADNTGTVVSTTSANNRVINVINGNLYFSTGSGTTGIYEISGTPTVSGATATEVIAEGGSPYGFSINAAGTVAYIADDGTGANAAGIEKWVLQSGTWNNVYTFTTSSGDSLRGLAVDWSTGTLYASSPSALYKVTDAGAADTMSAIAAAPTGTVFGGLVLAQAAAAPVPEPASLGVMAAGALMLLKRRR